MKRLCLFVLLIRALETGSAYAQVILGDRAAVHFATVDEAKEILTSRDEFVRRLSPFDRAARMKTDQDVSEKEYLEFVGQSVLEWNDAEKRNVTSALQGIQTELEALSLPFPKKMFMMKTTGDEEGGAPYTRANAIILPKAELTAPGSKLQKVICHELFHILSRANPELREKLYAVIGFVKCDELQFPAELESRKITNPDAPANDHCILLKIEGKDRWAVPILFSSTEKYDPTRGGRFFDYLQFQFLIVERQDDSPAVKPAYDGRKPKLVEIQPGSGFIEQVGNNTDYIIHPEEILADNFALLVLRERNVPSPEIIKKMEAILKAKRIAEPNAPPEAQKPRH